MARKSRTKGAAGEREAAARFEQATGIPAHRAAQRCGKHGDADLAVPEPLHLETKRIARIAAVRYLEQAEREAREGRVPVVVMRQDRDTEWVVMLRLDNVARFAEIISEARNRPCL
jgi:hypothetical protein